MEDINFVVVNYRTPEDLVRCVESISRSKDDLNVSVVAANVSPLEADSVAAESLYERGLIDAIIQFSDNVGYAKACNIGSLAGSAPIVAFLNADVEMTSGSISSILKAFENNPDVGIVGPKQVNDKGLITHGGIFGTNDAPSLRGWMMPDSKLYSDERDDAVTVMGSAFFVRRAVWDEMSSYAPFRELYPEEVGAFLPTPFYYEETFCSYLCRHLGYKVLYLGTARIIHNWHQSVRKNNHDSWASTQWDISRKMFKDACEHIGIVHDIKG